MRYIKAPSIGLAQERVIQFIVRDGHLQNTEDSEACIDLMEPTCIHVDDPLAEPMVSPCSQYGERFTQAYQDALCLITPRKNDGTDATYTYGNRLRDYPQKSYQYSVVGKRTLFRRAIDSLLSRYGYVHVDVGYSEGFVGDGRGGGIDQIRTSIIDRLIESPNSRRAEAITWVPLLDMESPEPPCLQIVWARINHLNQLCVVVLFRSNDMLSASGQNLYAITYLQGYLLDEINKGRVKKGMDPLTRGWIECISCSPHIYWKRDMNDLLKFLKKLKMDFSLLSQFSKR